jgi:hypothetical protein
VPYLPHPKARTVPFLKREVLETPRFYLRHVGSRRFEPAAKWLHSSFVAMRNNGSSVRCSGSDSPAAGAITCRAFGGENRRKGKGGVWTWRWERSKMEILLQEARSVA